MGSSPVAVTYDNLYCIREFKRSSRKVNKHALLKYEHLKQSYIFSTIKSINILDNSITVHVHNERSLSKHADDIIRDDRIIDSDIIGFTI